MRPRTPCTTLLQLSIVISSLPRRTLMILKLSWTINGSSKTYRLTNKSILNPILSVHQLDATSISTSSLVLAMISTTQYQTLEKTVTLPIAKILYLWLKVFKDTRLSWVQLSHRRNGIMMPRTPCITLLLHLTMTSLHPRRISKMLRSNLPISGLLRTSCSKARWDLILFAHLLVALLTSIERKQTETLFNIPIHWSKVSTQISGTQSQMRRWSQKI